jgi:peptidoglycan/LPS O-acetylase OafA/YrhL
LTQNPRIPELNGLRGVAILLVLYTHSLGAQVVKATGFPWIINDGWTAVTLFFIHSGFVLYLSYATGRRSMRGLADAKGFYAHRWRRLYPLFMINTLVGGFLAAGASLGSVKDLVLTLTTLSMFSQRTYFPPQNPVLWSLVLEIWFSLLFPLLALAVARFGLKRTALAVFILAFATRLAGALYSASWVGRDLVSNAVLARLDDFMLGMVLCRLHLDPPAWLERASKVLLPVAVLALLGAFLGGDFRDTITYSAMGYPWVTTLLQLGYACLILAGLRGQDWFRACMRFRPLQVCGMACFSLYVWHSLAIQALLQPWTLSGFASFLVVTIALSMLSYRYIEFGQEGDLKRLFWPPAWGTP